ncbi:hypothetical protein ACW2Q0_00630 [Nocardia sp. R16R-3T]
MSGNGYTLAQIQQLREELEISRRLYMVEREYRMRQLIGDDVYDFVRGNDEGRNP